MSKGLTDAKRKAIKKYDETHTRQLNLKLNLKTDADIFEHLEKQESIQGYIKKLIREDMIEKPQIVLCKDCKHYDVDFCKNLELELPPDWFCGYGKKSE